jgi:hypothetical protein
LNLGVGLSQKGTLFEKYFDEVVAIQPEGVRNLPDILRQAEGIGAIWAGQGDMSVATDLRGNVTHLKLGLTCCGYWRFTRNIMHPAPQGQHPGTSIHAPGARLSHRHYRARKDYFWSGGGSAAGSPAGRSSGLAMGLTSGWLALGLARYRNSGALAERMIVSC